MDTQLKHLDLIQGVINRMSGNTFALKGWAVTLVAALFALSGKETDKLYFLITYVPIFMFWGLDAYYLLQGRLFRSLYDKVRGLEEAEIDFNMDTSLPEFKTKKNPYLNCFISATELWFYFPLALLSTGIIVITHP
jgi:hypothetical protein